MEATKNKKGELDCKMSILQRVVLINSLPQEGGRPEIVINRSIVSKLDLDNKTEVEKYNIKTTARGFEMTPAGLQHFKTVTFSMRETERIVEGLTQMENKKQLTEGHLHMLEVFEKHVPKKDKV